MFKRIFYGQGKSNEATAAPWSSSAEFAETWKGRIALMASHISTPGVVADFGCGMMWLKPLLPPTNSYLGIDYMARDPQTIVADLNRDSLAGIRADVGFLSGVLEYVQDVPAFVEKLKALALKQIILSYCTLETHPDMERRRHLNWVSHESIYTFLKLFLPQYNLTALDSAQGDTILVFNRKPE